MTNSEENRDRSLKGPPRKSFFEIVLMPIVIAILGSAATFAITTYQARTSKEIADAQRASAERMALSDRQLKALELFSRMIVSEKETEKQMAVRLLTAVDAELARQLTASIEANPTFSPIIKKEAQAVAEAVPRGYAFAVVGSFRTFGEAESFANRIEKSALSMPEIYLAENDYYAVTLGGYLQRQEAAQRVRIAKDKGIAADAYVWTSTIWGDNLRR